MRNVGKVSFSCAVLLRHDHRVDTGDLGFFGLIFREDM